MIFWSLAFVFTRLSLQYFSAFPLGFLRYFAASAALLVMLIFSGGMKPPRLADIKWFAAQGAFGFFLYMIFFNKGCETVSASTSSLVIATCPIITALLARFVYGERLRRFQWAAVALEFLGVVVLMLMKGGLSVSFGVLLLFVAAVFFSVYNLLQRKLSKNYTPLQATAFSVFAGTLMLAVFLPSSLREAAAAPPVQLIYIAALGVFPGAIAFVTWSRAFARAKRVSSVSNYMFFTPLFASLFGFLIVGEVPDSATIVGGAIIIVGVFLFNFGGKIFAARE